MAQVTVIFAGQKVTSQKMTHHPFVVGRDSSCDISIDNVGVSRNHCQFTWDGKRFYIEDLESSNGTYHRGQKIRKAPLADGDQIQVGKHTLVFNRSANELPPPPKGGAAEAAGDAAPAEKDAMSDAMMTFKMDARLIHAQMVDKKGSTGPQRAADVARSFGGGASTRRSSGGFLSGLWRTVKGLVVLGVLVGAVLYLLWYLKVVTF